MTKPLDVDPEDDSADSVDFDDLDLDEELEDEEDDIEDTCPVCRFVLDDDGDCPNPECSESPYHA